MMQDIHRSLEKKLILSLFWNSLLMKGKSIVGRRKRNALCQIPGFRNSTSELDTEHKALKGIPEYHGGGVLSVASR